MKKNIKKTNAESKARRKVAKRWTLVEHGKKYIKHAVRESCNAVMQKIKEECFDGILLNLKAQSSDLPMSVQKRLLRRIVEKRVAQSTYHQVGKKSSRFACSLQRSYVSQSMQALHKHQFCA